MHCCMMDKIILGRHCHKFFKFTFVLLAFMIVYFTWTFIFHPEDKMVIKVIQKNGNLRIVETKETLFPADSNLSFDDDELIPKQYDFRIITIVYNRAESLLRLLNSINEANYYNDQIKLEVWIDRSKEGVMDENVLNTASSFHFRHGDFSVHPHPIHVGIYGQWLDTWKPVENSSEIAVILEDDCEVSPLFYKYLKTVHQKYDQYSHINGYALQGISIKHSGRKAGFLEAPYDNPVFIYPVLGSWGFSPSKKNWMDFLSWVKVALTDSKYKPYIPGNVVTTWYQEFEKKGKQTGMWTIWHIHYAWKNKEFTLYCNFKGHEGLTANWKESGLHYSRSINTGRSNPLLMSWKPEYDNLPDNPVKLDLDGEIIKE